MWKTMSSVVIKGKKEGWEVDNNTGYVYEFGENREEKILCA